MLGASGAVAAVIAAYAVIYPTARVITIIPIWIIPLFIPVPAFIFAIVWFGMQILQGSSELVSPDMAGAVAWWAHIGGFVFGALFAVVAGVMARAADSARQPVRDSQCSTTRPTRHSLPARSVRRHGFC